MEGIFLLLGSNLGDRKQYLENARNAIGDHVGPIHRKSKIHVSSAWGIREQPDFFNQVLEIKTSLSPAELLDAIQKIEIDLGRIRYEKWGPRIIDIDILYYNDLVINSNNLIIPHEEIANRRFTLEPLTEIAPEFIHPVLQKNNSELLELCEDSLLVQTLSEA